LSPSKGYLRPDSSRVLEVMKVGTKFGGWSERRLRVNKRTRLHETSRVRLRKKTSRDREFASSRRSSSTVV
jgi:hypothetical protein